MRGQGVALAVALGLCVASPARAQSDAASPAPAAPRTAEQFIETAREAYSVRERAEVVVCPESVGNEIVVCATPDRPNDQSLPSPTERANAAGERPPDRIPDAPDVFGLPPCSAYQFCSKVGRAPPPIFIIDLAALPEALTPEEAALVFRAEDLPRESPSPEAASPAAAP